MDCSLPGSSVHGNLQPRILEWVAISSSRGSWPRNQPGSPALTDGFFTTEPVHPKGNQSWMFIGRIVDEAETPILWPPDAKKWLIWKDPDAGKYWRREEKGTTGWDGWVASLTRWTWVWANSRRRWRTRKSGVLQSKGSQSVERDLVTEQQLKDSFFKKSQYCYQPHGLQHTRLPCPSLSPGVCLNSCPLSQWCHPTISSSVAPFSS